MATFYVRAKSSKGEAKLYFQVNRFYLRWQVCSGITVNVQDWEKAQKSPTALNKYFNTPSGAKVQEQMRKVEGVLNDLTAKGVLTCNDDKEKLESAISSVINADAVQAMNAVEEAKREAEEKRLCVIHNYYDYFYEGIKSGDLRQKRGAKYSESSVRVWFGFGKFLKDYTPKTMTFNEITKKFADGFTVYLEKLGLMPKTINKQILCFRRLCNAAALDERNTNLVSVKVWVEREVKDREKRAEIALSDAEIDALYEMELTGVREEVRDLWVLGYLSGQRVSDYTNLTRDNFKVTPNGTEVIVLEQQKTKNEVVVPILDERVKAICRKYHYDFPKRNFRDIDRYIKEILCQLSETVVSLREWYRTELGMKERQKEVNYLEMCRNMKAGKRLTGDRKKYYNELRAYACAHESGDLLWKRDNAGRVLKQKWELVSSHTARRAAVTNLYNSGLYDVRDIMSISGHTTLSNFEKYIKRGSVEQAERIAAKARKAKEVQLYKAV